MTAPDLHAATEVIEIAEAVVGKAVRHLAASGGPDVQQVVAYDIAHAASAVATARSLLDYGAKGDVEAQITCAFAADMAHDLITRLTGRASQWGVDDAPLAATHEFLATYRDPAFL